MCLTQTRGIFWHSLPITLKQRAHFSPLDWMALHCIYVTEQWHAWVCVCVCLSVQTCLRKRCKVRERIWVLSLYSQIMAAGPLILPSATLSTKQLDLTWQATFGPGIKMATNKDASSQPEEISNQVSKGKEKQVVAGIKGSKVIQSLYLFSFWMCLFKKHVRDLWGNSDGRKRREIEKVNSKDGEDCEFQGMMNTGEQMSSNSAGLPPPLPSCSPFSLGFPGFSLKCIRLSRLPRATFLHIIGVLIISRANRYANQ